MTISPNTKIFEKSEQYEHQLSWRWWILTRVAYLGLDYTWVEISGARYFWKSQTRTLTRTSSFRQAWKKHFRASNIVGSSSNNSFVPVNTTEIKPGESQDSSEDEQPEFLDMSWPKGDPKKQAVYIFLIGITGPLWLLLPDVRRPGREKYVAITFFGSIFAIAVYRYISGFTGREWFIWNLVI